MPNNGLITKNNRVIILGAGVCGLYAGLELSSAGVPVTVIERETSPGGLAAGLKREPKLLRPGCAPAARIRSGNFGPNQAFNGQ